MNIFREEFPENDLNAGQPRVRSIELSQLFSGKPDTERKLNQQRWCSMEKKELKGKVDDAVKQAKHKVEELTDEIKERAEVAAHKVKGKAKHALDEMKHTPKK